jgi:hypothetical protein
MVKHQYIAVIALPIIVVATIVSIFSTGFLDASDERIQNVKLEISYSGAWEGRLYSNEDVQDISGFTKKTLIVVRPYGDEWTLTFEAEKKDNNMNQMKVKIKLIDGTILGETQTVEPFGRVSITLEI